MLMLVYDKLSVIILHNFHSKLNMSYDINEKNEK